MKQTIGEFLATLRKAKGLTQEDVADKLSISNKTLSSWETNRTTPDALTLPAIADLYDMTVDEILRGERTKVTNSEQTQISEKARFSLIKKKYGKFSIKHFMFTAFGLLAILINLLGFAFLVYTSVSTWIGILLSIIGICGTVTLTILLIFFEHSTLLSEGIVAGENLNEKPNENSNIKIDALALCIKHKNSISLTIFSIPYLIFAIVTLIILIVTGAAYTIELTGVSLTINRTAIFIGFICASAVIGLIYLIAGICDGLMALKKFGAKTQQESHQKNKKLFKILSGVCTGILTLFLIAPIVFSFVTIDVLNTMWIEDIEETKVHTKDFEKFRELSQTLILDDETVAELGLSSNRFILKLPENWEDGHEEFLTDLGNGFYGTIDNEIPDLLCPYKIMYKYDKIENEETGETNPIFTTVANGTIVKVFHNKKHTEYDFVLYLPTNIQEKHIKYQTDKGENIYYDHSLFLIEFSCGDFVGKNFSTGEYGLFHLEHYYVKQLAWFCYIVIASVTIIICAIIYLSKRKKIIYKL